MINLTVSAGIITRSHHVQHTIVLSILERSIN